MPSDCEIIKIPGFNMYCSVRNHVSLFFLGDRYLNIWKHLNNEYLNNYRYLNVSKFFYQHYGDPPHNCLQLTFSVASPFSWFVYLKDRIYFNPITTIEDCQIRVSNAFECLSPDSIRGELILRCGNVWMFRSNY